MKTQTAAFINYYTALKKSRKLRTFYAVSSAAHRRETKKFCLSDSNPGVRASLRDFLRSDQQVRIPSNTENGIEMATGHGLMYSIHEV